MDTAEARAILGLHGRADPEEARLAFRRLLREAHPDRNDASDAAARTREIVGAYRALRDGPPVESNLEAAAASDEVDDEVDDEVFGDAITLVDTDTIGIALPAEEAFAVLLEVAHRVGDVTYLDRQNELLEALLRTEQGVTVSMVISLQGRANGVTEAFVTLEAFDAARGALPMVADVTALLVSSARQVLAGR